MNKVILVGRLTRDPDIRMSANGENTSMFARYSLAVDRRFKKEGEQSADFINCVCFGKSAEFAEKYLKKGTKIGVIGRIQTGSYTNREGQKVYTTDVVVEEQEFAESKSAAAASKSAPADAAAAPAAAAPAYAASAAPAYAAAAAPATSYSASAPLLEEDDEELPFV